jgi:hypothetical protein
MRKFPLEKPYFYWNIKDKQQLALPAKVKGSGKWYQCKGTEVRKMARIRAESRFWNSLSYEKGRVNRI